MAVACARSRPRAVVGIALAESNHIAAELAVQTINDSGGAGRATLALTGLGWKPGPHADPTEALAWADRLARIPALVAVVGTSDSSSTLAIAAYLNQAKVPLIVPIATNPAVTNIGEWTYRTCLSDAVQGPALARHAIRSWGKKRLAIFYVNDDYGRALTHSFETSAGELGAAIVAAVPHRDPLQEDDEEMITAEIERLKADPPDAIVLFELPESGDFTVRKIREAGLRCDLLAGDGLALPRFFTLHAPEKEGMRASTFFFAGARNDAARTFFETFRARTGIEPSLGRIFTYDAVHLVRDAVAANGPTRSGVKAYLDRAIREGTVLRTATGAEFRLGADHDARRPLYVVEVHGGRTQLVETMRVE